MKAPAPPKGARAKKPKYAPPRPEPKPESIEEVESRRAADKLNQAKSLLSAGKKEAGRRYLEEVVSKYPGTKAAAEAQELLRSAKDGP